MRKHIAIAVLISLSLISFAQTKQNARPKKTGNEWHAAGDAVLRSKKFADNMTAQLSLDETATKKVHDLYLSNTKPVDEIKMSPGTPEDKNELLKTNRDVFNDNLKKILTPAQFEKYLKIQARAPLEL